MNFSLYANMAGSTEPITYSKAPCGTIIKKYVDYASVLISSLQLITGFNVFPIANST